MQNKRIAIGVVLFLGIFSLPWWLVALGAFAAACVFDYVELILLACVYDLTYAAPSSQFFHIPFFFTLSACVLYALLVFLKTYTLTS